MAQFPMETAVSDGVLQSTVTSTQTFVAESGDQRVAALNPGETVLDGLLRMRVSVPEFAGRGACQSCGLMQRPRDRRLQMRRRV